MVTLRFSQANNKLYFSKNGTWQNSGVPTSGSTGTGAIPLTDPASTDFGFYMPSINFTNGSYHAKFHLNMGLGFFGTTAFPATLSACRVRGWTDCRASETLFQEGSGYLYTHSSILNSVVLGEC